MLEKWLREKVVFGVGLFSIFSCTILETAEKLKAQPKELIRIRRFGSVLEVDTKKLIDKTFESFKVSRKMVILLFIIGFMISFFSTSGGIDEEWASDVANALITINGLLLGFAILGMTVFSKRGYTEAMFRKSVEESAKEFTNHVEEMIESVDETAKKGLYEKFISSLFYPFVDAIVMRESLLISMQCLLVSIGSALCLFGINAEILSNPYFEYFFRFAYCFSIIMFLYGTYYIIYGVRNILKKGMQPNVDKQIEIIRSIFEKKIRYLEKKLKEKKKKT